MFHFTCFNTEDPHDPEVGLIHGDLAIPGYLLRRDVFDPVIQQVRRLTRQPEDVPPYCLSIAGRGADRGPDQEGRTATERVTPRRWFQR